MQSNKTPEPGVVPKLQDVPFREVVLLPGPITADPEVILGSLGEFETCPHWVPVMDTDQKLARIALKTVGEHGFDQRASRAAKVRNASRLGSQS